MFGSNVRLAWIACGAGLITGSAMPSLGAVGLVDDFNSAGVGEYTYTILNDGSIGTTNVTLSDSTGALVATYAGSSTHEQAVFLRNDASLGIGETLLVDVAVGTTSQAMDFGLAVGATATPTAASAGDTDTRNLFDWLSVSIRPSQDSIRVNSSINGAVVTSSGVLTAVETTVSQLFIERVTATQFTVGYYNTSATRFDALTVDFTATNVGSAIGFFTDLRSAGSLGNFDNFRIVPEPASMALVALGGLMFVRRRRAA